MKIEVLVKNDAGEIVGRFESPNAMPALDITVWMGNQMFVTDSASNTYVRALGEPAKTPKKPLTDTVTPS